MSTTEQPTVPLEVRLLRALRHVESFAALRTVRVEAALEVAVQAHLVDRERLAILWLAKLIERDRARAAVAATAEGDDA